MCKLGNFLFSILELKQCPRCQVFLKSVRHDVTSSDKYIVIFCLSTFLLYPRHLCRRVYSFRFSVRPFVCSLVGWFVRSLVRSLFRNVRGIYVKVFVKVSLVVYIS